MAEMTAAAMNDLPDSDFAYIEPGGKVVNGKTEPRSLRHFPIHDAAHVRAAMARMSQSPFGAKARPKIMAAARKFGIDMAGKASELKAEDLTTGELDRWLAGKRPRRILVAPFYGPIIGPDGKGRDLDGEYFHEATDFYGTFPVLRASKSRLTDWHHVTFGDQADPMGNRMKGAILGHVELDEEPEGDGLWADFWANAGERRRMLVAMLERRNVPLYGSSQAVSTAVAKADDGAINVWPIYRHTITTSPQNTYAIVPALKAGLASSLDEIPAEALKALLVGLDPDSLDLLGDLVGATADPAALAGEAVAKAGRVLSARNRLALQAAIETLATLVADMAQEQVEELPAT